MHPSRTALEMERRAISINSCQSSLDSRNILSVLAPFENPQVAALFYASVDAPPKLLKILKRRNHGAPHHQPQKQHTKRANDGMLGRQDHRANRDHLQN